MSIRFSVLLGRKVILTYFVPIIIGLRIVDSNAYHEFIDGSNSQIFIDIYDSDLMTDYYIKQFLEADETTTEDESQKKYVSREDVLKEKRKEHVQNIRQNVDKNKRAVKQGICPKCGGKLVYKKGKYGTFQGCSNYPDCRYIKN